MNLKASTVPARIAALLAAIVVFSSLAPAPLHAEDGGLSATAVAKFAAGIASSMLLHEGAHALVAAATNTHMSWKAGNYNQPIAFTEDASSDAKGVAIYSSGLLAQLTASEVILQVDRIDKNDAFIRGMMTWNILNPILYSLDYWVFRVANKSNGTSYQGDIEGIEHYSSEATAQGFAIGITAIAAFQGYRVLKTQDWAPEWLKGTPDNVTLTPLRSGGAFLAWHCSF
jgi:hypothetical protein